MTPTPFESEITVLYTESAARIDECSGLVVFYGDRYSGRYNRALACFENNFVFRAGAKIQSCAAGGRTLRYYCTGAHFFHLESEHILSPLFNSAIEKSARKFALWGVSPAVAFKHFFTFFFCFGREPQQREVGKLKLLALVALDYRHAVE